MVKDPTYCHSSRQETAEARPFLQRLPTSFDLIENHVKIYHVCVFIIYYLPQYTAILLEEFRSSLACTPPMEASSTEPERYFEYRRMM